MFLTKSDPARIKFGLPSNFLNKIQLKKIKINFFLLGRTRLNIFSFEPQPNRLEQ
jgi:hypothetical protein